MNQQILPSELVAEILTPFKGEQPTGIDSREDPSHNSLYQMIRDARVQARNNERTNQAAGEVQYFSMPEWRTVLELAPKLLIEQSKDVEIIAWYIEALCREYGFQGVAVGFYLAAQFIENFSTALYPLPDEEGLATQLAALSGLNGYGGDGTLIGVVKSIPLTQGELPGPLATWQCEQAYENDRLTDEDRKAARLRQGGLSKEDVLRVVTETETPFLINTMRDIHAAIESFSHYQSVIDQYAGDEPQPTGNIKQALDSCRQMLLYIAGDRLQGSDIQPENTELDSLESDSHLSMDEKSNLSAEINTREQAIRQLQLVANFFRKTEPHSPMSYSIEQAIRWSYLPLTELIKELIPDEGARAKYQNLSGIETQ